MSLVNWNAAVIAGKSFAIITMFLINSPSFGQTIEEAKEFVDAAKEAYENGNKIDKSSCVQAKKILEPMAAKGNPEAQFILADLFTSGCQLTKKDAIFAYKMGKAAAEGGHPDGQLLHAQSLAVGLDVPKIEKNLDSAYMWAFLSTDTSNAEVNKKFPARYQHLLRGDKSRWTEIMQKVLFKDIFPMFIESGEDIFRENGKKLAKECLKRLFRGCDNLRISDLRDDNPESSPTPTTSTSKLDKAKSTCTELGFILGTEKHGDCVLKMMDN